MESNLNKMEFFFFFYFSLSVHSAQTALVDPDPNPGTFIKPRLLYIFTQSMGLIGIFDKHCVEHNEETVSLSSA